MSITGTKQSLITAGAFTPDSVGNIYQEGHEDEIMVQSFSHEVIIPRDPQSGQPTGQRVHKPVKITKVFDKSSPLLLAALPSGERLTDITIQWCRTSAAGTQEHCFATKLEGAIIVDIKDYMHNCQDPANSHFTHLEDVEFTYRKITWPRAVSGTSGSNDWRSPVTG
jgi:type VI secretion system secreted protein Hcp